MKLDDLSQNSRLMPLEKLRPQVSSAHRLPRESLVKTPDKISRGDRYHLNPNRAGLGTLPLALHSLSADSRPTSSRVWLRYLQQPSGLPTWTTRVLGAPTRATLRTSAASSASMRPISFERSPVPTSSLGAASLSSVACLVPQFDES